MSTAKETLYINHMKLHTLLRPVAAAKLPSHQDLHVFITVKNYNNTGGGRAAVTFQSVNITGQVPGGCCEDYKRKCRRLHDQDSR